MPQMPDIHIDQPLSNFAVEYKNAKYIAGEVMPVVPVDKKSDKYFVYDKKDRFTPVDTVRGPKSKANEIDWNVGDSTYNCIDHALAGFVSDGQVANADAPIRPREKSVSINTDLILLRREIRVAAAVFTAGNFASGYKVTLTGDDILSNYATSDPIGVIDTAKDACMVDPNIIVMGQQVYNKLKRHPQLLSKVTGGSTTGQPATVNAQVMAEIFEVDRIIIGKTKYNSANKGQTFTKAFVWGKYIFVGYVDPDPQLEGVCWGKTFQWKQMATDIGFKVRTWRDESRGGGGEMIEVETSFDEKIVCSDVGYLISSAIE